MADIDSLGFANCSIRDTIDEIEFRSRSFACDSAEDRHVLLGARETLPRNRVVVINFP